MTHSQAPALTRTRRSELLAIADAAALAEIADRCIGPGGLPDMVVPPEVGTVVMIVREPVEATRFQLGDVLVTRAEVIHRGTRGWAMRMGEDRLGALAAAMCDAEAAAEGPHAESIDALCLATAARQARERALEWRELSETIVRFEEM